ncbi:hypothetical protein ONZ43_g3947 [Nemania bipapillata]|uniref:Uncharacterized protein n=1 Tax=Nemania bipapillata TaxID=110536 RepID=A0ACC2IU12_9PEZI|nr:hypothetical protein ONZ43_g3947 [Nemania bipapillata]
MEEFNQPPYPPYAILSHVWGREEITFEDMRDVETASKKAGFAKLEFARQIAAAQQLEYVWVDTCCINKSSSAELTVAINSIRSPVIYNY